MSLEPKSRALVLSKTSDIFVEAAGENFAGHSPALTGILYLFIPSLNKYEMDYQCRYGATSEVSLCQLARSLAMLAEGLDKKSL